MRDYIIVAYNDGATTMNRRSTGEWRKELVAPGCVSLLTHAAQSHWRWSEDIEVTHLYLSPGAMADVAAEAYDCHIKEVELRDILKADDPVLAGIAASLAQEAREAGLGGRLYVDSLRNHACVHILRRYANVIFREPNRSGGAFARPMPAAQPVFRRKLGSEYIIGGACGGVRAQRVSLRAQIPN
jgi:AraC family transcriptional regulator